jgi:hypothetical protein
MWSHVQFFAQVGTVFFSLLSGGFWMASVSKYVVPLLPLKKLREMPAAALPPHEAKSNMLAVLFAGLPAIS